MFLNKKISVLFLVHNEVTTIEEDIINIKNSYYISFQYYFLASVTLMLILKLLVIQVLNKHGQFQMELHQLL